MPGTTLPVTVSASASTGSLSQEGSGSATQNTTIAGVPNSVTWPSDTDILLAPGTKKVSLALQRPALRGVVQDAVENVRASLLFDNAFPDAFVVSLSVRGALLSAANTPRALNIRDRLAGDDEYLNKLIRLVSTRFLDYNMTNGAFSHVHAFPFSVPMSRNAVQQLYRSSSWVLVRHLALFKSFRDSWQTTSTPSRRH